MSKITVDLYLRRHTAKILRQWAGSKSIDEAGCIIIKNGRTMTNIIGAEIQKVPYPIRDTEYKGLPVHVPVTMPKFMHGKYDFRSSAQHIDREGMKRIDLFIHVLMINQAFMHYMGSNMADRWKSVDFIMEYYQLTDADVKSGSIYKQLQRTQGDVESESGPLRRMMSKVV